MNIGQLEINRTRRTIAAGTYGRGAWRSVLPNRADLDQSGTVDASDLAMLLGAWGACGTPFSCPADIDGNGTIDGADIAVLLSAWGQ